MTAVWLLPVVAAEVAAATGGLLAPHLLDPSAQFVILITSYVLWAYSVPVAFGMLLATLITIRYFRAGVPFVSPCIGTPN